MPADFHGLAWGCVMTEAASVVVEMPIVQGPKGDPGGLYASKADGEAATKPGDAFGYPDGAGRLIYAERTANGAGDAGGNSQVIAEAATKAQIDTKAAIADLGNVMELNMARFGLREAGSAAQNLAAFTDAIGEYGGGAQPVKLIVPPGSYDMDLLGIETPNVWIDGQDSTFVEGARIATSPAASGFRLLNARFYVDYPEAIVTLNSSFGGWSNVTFEKFGAGDGYMAMTGDGASDNVFTNTVFRGGNGMFIEGERLLFNGVHGVGRTVGGDDFLVFKARNRRTGDIIVTGAYAENYSNGFAIGSEVGTLGANSAARAGRVENLMIDMLLRNCAYGAFIKPGAIDVAGNAAAYDWRDGLVRGVTANLRVADPTGFKTRRPIVISPARNALIEDVKIDLEGVGRFAASADTACWAHIYMIDSTAYAAPGAGGIVRDVDLTVSGYDPHGGVDNGVNGAPGIPPTFGVYVEKQNAAVGTVERLTVDARIDGTKGAGIAVSPGLDNAVTVARFRGRALCNAPISTQGGIWAQSIMRAPGRNSISMANATYKPIFLSAGGDVIGRREFFDMNAPAGVQGNVYRPFNHAVWLRKGAAVSAVTVGASSGDYLTLDFRVLSGTRYDGTAPSSNAFGTAATSATAITANVQFDLAAFPASGAIYDDRYLAAGALIRAQKSGAGAGRDFIGTVFLDYVQIGDEA